MIGLLDPALFLQRSDQEVQREFELVLRACKQHLISLPALDEYWHALWSQLGRPLEDKLSPVAKRALQEVRKLGSHQPHLPIPAAVNRAWRRGFQQLFGAKYFTDSWEERMAAAAIRAMATGEEVVIFTRRILGRNLTRHTAGNCVLDENTRWVLHLQPQGVGHRQVLCVHHPRNLTERWTSRFDWRLPGALHGDYPFCPPDAWWKGTTPAVGTVSSKPAWLDRHGNGWARPNIQNGAGYHWDVLIVSPGLRQTVGLNQINVVEFGAPSTEGAAGQIHHVPTGKAGKLTGTGWTC